MVAIVAMLVFAVSARAAVTFPLGGYTRAGKCMPVSITESLTGPILADGAVPTHVATGFTGIAPVLILTESPGPLRVGSSELPLRPLLPDQRLVGVVGSDSSLAAGLFPDQTVLTVSLDPSNPLPGPPMAWETLDAVILDAPPRQLEDLLSLGVAVVVRSIENPDTRWPWQRIGRAWVIRPNLAGPAGAIGGELAYLPSQAWTPGRSPELRRQIALAGVLVVLILLIPLLIRSKRGMLLTLMLFLLGSAGIGIWRSKIPVISSVEGQIIIRSPELVQIDAWKYLAAGRSGGSGSFTNARPVVASAGHASLIQLKLDCDQAGALAWSYTLPPNARLATLGRAIVTPAQVSLSAPQTPVTSPLHELAKQGYLSANTHIAGQLGEGDWPSVIIEH